MVRRCAIRTIGICRQYLRRERRHHGEVDTFFLSENENPGQVARLQADVSRYALRSRIPGENDNFLNAGGLANLPSERVLTAAAPDDQNFHGTLAPGKRVNGRYRW